MGNRQKAKINKGASSRAVPMRIVAGGVIASLAVGGVTAQQLKKRHHGGSQRRAHQLGDVLP
ncbi:hypothetical protein NY056_02035 [Corynebacterium diphtheriae bv. gravis]|nr:hypothetical protein NY056_02035 [Corynebacterium diphtheriae bv. gravis]